MRERMGSGGLRGLQIPRSGVNRVRGGFDSHAFPPILALLAVLLVASGLPARARGASAPDSTAAADSAGVSPYVTPSPDSLANSVLGGGTSTTKDQRGPVPRARVRTRAAITDTTAAARTPWYDQPRWVMARSLVVPGWGQVHNHAWWK